MPSVWRFVVFLSIVLTVWTGMHAYVLWRAWPLVTAVAVRRVLLGAAVLLWLSFPLGRFAAHAGMGRTGRTLEAVGSLWIGVLFISLVCLLAADLVTGFGWLFPRLVPAARVSAFAAAGLLSCLALVQGLRAPVVKEYEVKLAGLPPALDGKVLVQLSDMHLGDMLGRRWLQDRVRQVEALHPDVLVITGDLIDGDAGAVEPLLPELRRFHAPLGVWAVTGNHEFYAGLERCVALMESAGFKVLRDRSELVAPGLVFAGVDDLSARRQFKMDGDPVARALQGRPEGATVFLCHSPLQVQEASGLGAGLMLSGHTHDGQIWPFGYIVKLFYPYLVGQYAVGGMTLIVTPGTGTWGPPMRLFGPGEILRITLHPL